jgi:acyl-lipid omega-6 desaturase (Delta-12 desaturase)
MNVPHWKDQAVSWQAIVTKYEKPDLGRSIWEIVNSFCPFFVLWGLMYWSLSVSYWLTLLLAPFTAGFLVRIFIILHDCGHGSFFKSVKANDVLGTIAGFVCFTPYLQWRRGHAIHHATSGDLDRRGPGADVYTMTVDEYLSASRWGRIKYRLYRNPLIMFGLGPVLLFIVAHRFPWSTSGKREIVNLHLTNLAMLAMILIAGATIGFKAFLLVHLPVVWISATAGVWLFYIQHQFEDTYWEHHPDWRYLPAALQGSSYFKLPKVFQWFTGNIGFHHIHHLSPRIPNYNLERAYKENPLLQQVTVISFFESLGAISLKLWDEKKGHLVGFRHLESLRQS